MGAVLETAEKEAAVARLSLHTASAGKSAGQPGPPPSSADRSCKVARAALGLAKFGLCEQPSGAGAEGAGKGRVFRQIPEVVVALWSASGLVRATKLCDPLART